MTVCFGPISTHFCLKYAVDAFTCRVDAPGDAQRSCAKTRARAIS
jgi:hypothetical protein